MYSKRWRREKGQFFLTGWNEGSGTNIISHLETKRINTLNYPFSDATRTNSNDKRKQKYQKESQKASPKRNDKSKTQNMNKLKSKEEISRMHDKSA